MAGNPFGVGYASAETIILLAKETTRGTAPTAPTSIFPTKAPKYKPNRVYFQQDVLEGSMVKTYGVTPGQRYDGHGWDSYIWLDSFPNLLVAELGSPDTMTAAPTATTLSVAATAGATSISTAASIAAGSWITLGTVGHGDVETHQTGTPTGTGPYTIPLDTALNYNHASGAAVTGLTSHQFSLLNNVGQGNQPPSFSIWDFAGGDAPGNGWRLLTAAQLDELTIKGAADALVDYTCTWFANPAVAPATAPSGLVTDAATPVPSWTTSLVITPAGGTATQYTDVEDFQINFKRDVKPIPALTGTEEYFMYFAGPIDTTGNSFTVIEQANAPELTLYENGVNCAMTFTMYDVVNGYALQIQSSSAQFVTGELDRSKDYVEAKLTCDFLPTATDATAGGVSPVLVTVANSVATAYN